MRNLDFVYTPYNSTIDDILIKLKTQEKKDEFSELDFVIKYINYLEHIIYSPTE